MRPQPLICVTDVEASSRWYQRLLSCRGAHGGRQYEQLVKDGSLIWFEVDDFDAVNERAAEMGAEIVLPAIATLPMAKAAPTTGSVGCAIRMATPSWSPAPYGTADGAWRPGPDLFT